jgi:hypothetical protein
MINKSILNTQEIGYDGRIRREPTLLGATLIGIGFAAGIAAIVFAFSFL